MTDEVRVFKRNEGGAIVEVAPEGVSEVILDPDEWPRYRKKVDTSAQRIEGPFTVETSEGPLTCKAGYLAVDARGYPYPIATDEFELIYDPVA